MYCGSSKAQVFWRRGGGSFKEDSQQFNNTFDKKWKDQGVQQVNQKRAQEHAFFEGEDEEFKELDFHLRQLGQTNS